MTVCIRGVGVNKLFLTDFVRIPPLTLKVSEWVQIPQNPAVASPLNSLVNTRWLHDRMLRKSTFALRTLHCKFGKGKGATGSRGISGSFPLTRGVYPREVWESNLPHFKKWEVDQLVISTNLLRLDRKLVA